MADEEPEIELGEHTPVEGAPLARVADRLTWPIEASTVRDREGATQIRTPDGPRAVSDLLSETDTEYFPTREAFVETLDAAIGDGPVTPASQ